MKASSPVPGRLKTLRAPQSALRVDRRSSGTVRQRLKSCQRKVVFTIFYERSSSVAFHARWIVALPQPSSSALSYTPASDPGRV